MKRTFSKACGILLLFLSTLSAQSVVLNSTVSRSEIYIGDKIEYVISVEYPDSSHIELPGVVGNLGTFEVKEYQVTEPVLKDGVITQKWIFNLSTFLSGDYVIPPQIVNFYQKNDTAKVQLYTEPIKVTVLTRNSEDVVDIIEVESVAAEPINIKMVAIVGATVVAVAGITFFVLYRRRKRRLEEEALPPYEEARRNLEALKKRDLIHTGAYKDHFFELTEILKIYISRRFNVDATEATSSELLERVTVISEIQKELKDFLPLFCEQTDLIKFARMTFDDEKNETINQYVEEFIEKTKPLEDAKEGAESAEVKS